MWKLSAIYQLKQTATNHESRYSDFLYRSPQLCNCVNFLPEMRGKWQSMTVCEFFVHVHMDVSTKANWKTSHSDNTGHKIILEEESFLPVSCQLNQAKTKTHKKQILPIPTQNKNTQGEAPLVIISIRKGQRGSISLVTAPGWLRWFQTRPLLQKALTLSIYKSYSGVQASVSYKYKREKLWS